MIQHIEKARASLKPYINAVGFLIALAGFFQVLTPLLNKIGVSVSLPIGTGEGMLLTAIACLLV